MGTRERWPDVLRGVCILFVVVVHARFFAMPAVGYVPDWALTFNAATAPFYLPALFAISGYFVPLSLRRGPVQFIWIKVLTILWPLLVWNALNTWRGMDITSWQDWLRVSYLWFLAYLFAYNVIAALLQRVSPWILFAASMLLAWLVPAPDWMGRSLSFAPYFFAGLVLARYRSSIASWARQRWAWLALVSGILACWLSAMPEAIAPPVIQILSLLAISLGIVFAVRWQYSRVSGAFVWLGQHSLEIYVLHWQIGLIIAPYLPKVGSALPTYIFDTAVVLVLTCLATVLFTLPGLRKAFSLRS